ncbi:uncharacterized protein CTRU02_211615 [Colletotrichum truncatum]|uniref:Uncharacterized protein n=1 Tax=Colletotrichum truncatum TaxID=5467 RepID=A0ACC3YLD7_COLTU|nr:uncharacterized protein CTRU02_14124 [Colletotrichum truncatum]KAF6782643.1 hypothetical protein CTRU02_14124 [Colletotrichum truncatum]
MCTEIITHSQLCGHNVSNVRVCDDATYIFGHGLQPCENTKKTTQNTSSYCTFDCPYRVYKKTWECCQCQGPNQRRQCCAFKGCNHLICRECKPLTPPERRQRTKESTQPCQLPIKDDISSVKAHDARQSCETRNSSPFSRIPIYDASIGDWV